MGKAALLTIAGCVLVGSFYTLTSQRSSVETTHRLGGHQYEVLARNAALAGYQLARQAIVDYDGFGVPAIDGTHASATYSVQIQTVQQNRGKIRSTGRIADGSGGNYEYTVEAVIERVLGSSGGGGSSEELPAFMEYAVIAGKDLRFGGSAGTELGNSPDGDRLNANVHSNRILDTWTHHANPTINGFGSYGDRYHSQDWAQDMRFFRPHQPGGAPKVNGPTQVELPEINVADLAERVPVHEHTRGNESVGNGTYSFGTADNPYVWRVDGNLTIGPGDIRFNGHVVFLVGGDVVLRGGYFDAANQGGSGLASNVAVYAAGGMQMVGGHHTIRGQFYINDDVDLDGSATIYGTLASRGKIEMRGNSKVHYRTASATLARVFAPEEEEIVFRLLSYTEW